MFALSGTIELQDRLRISNGDLTIAGQTAPGDGICVKNYSFTISADNVIVRYLSIRLGEDKRWENDAVNGSGDNVILDHCSVSFGVDEILSEHHPAGNFQVPIDGRDLEKGAYLLHIKTNGISSNKLIVRQ